MPSGVVNPRPPAKAAPPGGVWQLTQLPASARYLPRAAGVSAGAGAGAGVPAGAAPGALAAGVAAVGAGVAEAVAEAVPELVPEAVSEAAAAAVVISGLPGPPAMRSPASSHIRGRPVRFTLTFSPLLHDERAILHRAHSRAAAYVLSDGRGYRAANFRLFSY